jgi:hypothetical protein
MDRQRQSMSYDSSVASPFGCCGLFDVCSDEDILSLSLSSESFLDWLGFRQSDVCNIQKNFITWQRPEQAAGVCTEGYLADPCADPNTYEWGECDWTIHDFGRLRRGGPTRVVNNPKRYCENEPRWRKDGSLVTSEREWDALFAAEILRQDLRRYTVTGNSATPGLYDGLQQLVTNGYTDSDGRTCAMMDSLVVNWNGNTMAGGAGATWNGNALGATFDFIDVLRDMFRRIRQRISWAPRLNTGIATGDVVLVMPTFMTYCLLDAYTCWSVCPGQQYNEANMNTFEARTFRDGLNGGMFGAGQISLDGITIPLIAYDWELIQGPTTADIYMLTGSLGNTKLMYYEYQNAARAVNEFSDLNKFSAIESGRFLRWLESDHTCYEQYLEIRPRMISWAPWTNIRFQDVVCNTPTGPMTPDSCDESFFPETSFSVAECP